MAKQLAQSSLELLYHISRELASDLELRPVLTRILFLSLNYVGGISGSIIVVDEQGKPVESAIVHTGQVYDRATRQLRATLDRGLAGWVVNNRQPVLVNDTSTDERWLRRPDDAPDRTGPKSAISVPLMVGEQLVGVITLVHPETGFFKDEHLELVQAIADQASVAALNARHYNESRRQARIMTALAESAAALNTSLRLDDVLQRILEQISNALQVEAVSLALLDPASDELEFRAATGSAAQDVIGTRLKIGQGIAGWVAKEGRPIIVPQAEQDPHFYPEVDRRTGFETRSIASAPILLQGKVIGVIEAFNPSEGLFDADTLIVLTGIGSLAGTAIQNANLFENLKAAHLRYKDLFENSIDPILIANWHGRIIGANLRAVQVTGYPRGALVQMMIDQLHEVDKERIGKDLAILTSGKTLTYESVLHTMDGQEIPIDVYARQVNIDGTQRMQWVFLDITERKKLEQLRDDLASTIYHDLRLPLSNINYSLDVLEQSIPGEEDPAVKSIVETARRASARIQRLTDSLLDIQNLEAGQSLTNLETTSVRTLIEDSIEVIQPYADGRAQEIRLDIPEEILPVHVDTEMIRRVLVNLLENAIKFNSKQGILVVGAEVDGEMVKIWVEDEGPGIPPEEHRNIFNKYARVYLQAKGSGLGLAFCRLAVEAHGGQIWVDSQVGQGARFTFSLPLARS
jgi:two-component system, NtrC family, sensor histidine kinase KinB